MTRAGTRGRRARQLVGECLLWCAAGLGALCLVVAAASWSLGLTLLVFQSGSMSPEHEAGSLGIARTVDASDLRIGDVVSVHDAAGQRVTHRVTTVEPRGRQAELTLKGDTNPAPDTERYLVSRADRVVGSVPTVGGAVAWLQGRGGLATAGVVALGLLLVLRRSTGPAPRTGAAAGVPVAVTVLMLAGATGGGAVARALASTDAAWTDTATAVSGPVAAATLASPVALPTTQNCTGGVGSVTLRWGGVTPTPGPPLSSYRYAVEVWDRGTNQQLGGTQFQAHAGAAGSTQSVGYTSSTLGNLFGLNLVGTQNLQFRIRSHLVGTSWFGPATVAINVRAVTVLATTFSCNT